MHKTDGVGWIVGGRWLLIAIMIGYLRCAE